MKASYEGLLFSLASMITMGISNYLYKRSTEVLGATNTTFFYYLFSGIIAFFVWLIFREKQPKNWAVVAFAVIAVFLFGSKEP